MKAVVSKFVGIGQDKVDTEKDISVSDTASVSTQHSEENLTTNVAMHMQNIRRLNTVLTKRCKKCNCVKPPASHHCSVCGRCIARMDHHCPWVNNCVGFYNQKFFLQFLVYVALGSAHALFLIAWSAFDCMDAYCHLFVRTSTVVVTAIACFLAVLFLLFVVIMFVDQI